MDDTWHSAGPAARRRFLSSLTGSKQAGNKGGQELPTGAGHHRTDDGPFTRDRDRVRAPLEMPRSPVKWTPAGKHHITSLVLTRQE